MLLYHGSLEEVIFPEIRKTKYTKDFSWGFYCTSSYEQAYRWADRKSGRGIVNIYNYTENPSLKILKYPTHQISFHTIRALNCLEFERSEKIHD